MKPPSTNNCYNFRVISVDRIVDGDTIDVTFDLGFGICKSGVGSAIPINTEIGKHRKVNLQIEPFNLEKPIYSFKDYEEDKYIFFYIRSTTDNF